MRIILKIAMAEWKNLFYSPVAWLVLLFFGIACGIAFVLPLQEHWRLQIISFHMEKDWAGFNGSGLTKALMKGASAQLAEYLFLFIPLLTMGIMSREVNTGTIKLLYSSPIRVRDIVIGKYLGIFSLVLTLILFLATLFAIIPNLIINVDAWQYISTVLGLLLLANAYIAIGIFISSLTSYQIVAGVLTFIVFFILYKIDGLWQQYDFVRDLTYFLAIGDRTYYFLAGLVTSRDVFYFILITILFLGFTLIQLKSRQESTSWRVPLRRYVLWLLIILCAGYLTSIPGKVLYWDSTAKKSNTLNPEVQAVIKEMDGSPLTVTLYTNLLSSKVMHGLPQNRNFYIWKVWDQYRRFYPNMIYKYEYYYDKKDDHHSLSTHSHDSHPNMNLQQMRDKVAKELGVKASFFKSPEEIRKIVDFEKEDLDLLMKLEYKGKEAWLRTFQSNNPWPTQDIFAGSVKRLTRETPKILFTNGNFERSPFKAGRREYIASTTDKLQRDALINHGVDCDTISLSTRDIPADCNVLVVADPRSRLPSIEEQKINDYIKNGGNALILGEPGKTDNLNALLAPIGAKLDEGIIVNTNKDEMPNIFYGVINDAGAFMSEEKSMHLHRLYKKAISVSKIMGATNVSYLETAGFKIEPVMELKGDSDVWIEKGKLVADSAPPVFFIQEGDYRKDKYAITIKMNRSLSKGEQRLIVAGDADMLSADRHNKIGTSYYSWLLYNKFPTYVNSQIPKDLYFKSKPTLIKALSWTYLYIIPILVLVIGVIILTRRQRK